MRLALLVSSYSPAVGGVEVHVGALARGAAARGVDVTVLTQQLSPGWADDEVLDGVTVQRFPLTVPAKDYRYSHALTRHLRAHRRDFDVVHVHGYHTLVGPALLMAGGRGFVFTPHYHGTGHDRVRAALHVPYRPVARRVLRAASAVVCVSRAEAALLGQHFPESSHKVTVIPNGARPPRPSSAALARSVVEATDVVHVGRLESYKRVDLLVEAVAELPLPVRLVVVGEGPSLQPLREQAARLGVSDRVLLLGRLPQDDLDAALSRAGAVASVSEHEAFGLTLADALAAGVPVVASDIPAHRELLTGSAGALGHLVDRSDRTSLVAALVGALATPSRRAPAALLTWDDVVTRTLGLYTDVLDRTVE